MMILAPQERTEKLLEKIQTGEGIGACTFQSAPYWHIINLYHLYTIWWMYMYIICILHIYYYYYTYIYIDQIHYSIGLKEPFD